MKESSLFLLVTVLLSFTVPVVLLTTVLAIVCLLAAMPGLSGLGEQSYLLTIEFLETFGDGCPFMGILTIGCTGAAAGSIFGFAMLQHPLNLSGSRLNEPFLANKARQH